MRWTVAALGALFFALLGGVARAAPDSVEWVGSFDEAKKLAKERGALILIVLLVDEDSNNAQKTAFRDPLVVKASAPFVCLYANPMADHGETEVVVDGKKVRRCRDFPILACREHQQLWNDVRSNYSHLNTDSAGNSRMPFHFVIDPAGEVVTQIVNGSVEGGFDEVPAQMFADLLNQVTSVRGRGLTAEEHAKFTVKLAEAEKMAEAGNGRAALKICGEIVKANDRTVLAERAKALQAKLTAAGKADLARAAELISTEPAEAVALAEQVVENYAGSDLEKEAKSRLAEWKRDPKVKAALGEVAALKAARADLAKAEEFVGQKEYARALDLLDGVAKKLEGKSVGEQAKARAAELRADETIGPLAREQAAAKFCRGWITMARSAAGKGQTDVARSYLKRVIDEFPGTSFAEEAAKELEKLK